MKPVVVRHIPRVDPALAEALETYGVSTVHEAHGRTGLMLLGYRNAQSPDARLY